ncbi:MAG: beta-glucosidase [Clostridia bacterium]|nr:beta-glucosidase [Clostridia bacterium]
MVKKKTFIIWGVVIGILLALTIVLNVVAPMFDKILRLYLGETEGKVDMSGIENTENLDLQYYKSEYSSNEEFKNAEHAFAEEIAEEGIMLLKNDGALPLDKNNTVDVWGYSSWNFVYNGTGSGGAGSPSQQDLFDGLTHAGLKYNTSLYNHYSTSKYSITGKNGTYTANKSEYYTYGKGGTGLGSVNYATSGCDFTIFEIPFETVRSSASVSLPKKDTIAIYTMGRQGGESADVARYMNLWVPSNSLDREEDAARHYLQPNSVELDVLKKLKENYGKVVALVNSGCAMEMKDIAAYADAIVWCPALGSHGTLGLGDLLAGDENFSGHLPDTLVNDSRSAPAMQNMGDFKYDNITSDGGNARYVAYLEGIYVGYKYYETRYEDCVLGSGNASKADVYNKGGYDYFDTVAYPFGHGLSYTNFEWSGFEVSDDGDGENFTAKVTVKNVGGTAGKDVVQLYAQKPYIRGGVEKASAELIGFAKTDKLEPQATQELEISFKKSDLKSYDYKNAKTYILDEGDYYIAAAKDAHAAVDNILAAKGKTTADGMGEDGNAALVQKFRWSAKRLDKDDATGAEITNRFAHADDNLTYLSRSDWSGTYPVPYATNKSATPDSMFGDYSYSRTATSLLAKQFKSYDSLNPDQTGKSKHTYSVSKAGTKGSLQLIDMRELAYDDPSWDRLLDQISLEELQQLIINSGLGTPEVKSINKPKTLENDGPSGWSSTIGGANGVSSDTVYPSEIVVAGSFNVDIAERYGDIMGESALYYDRNGWYAPGMNLHRTPFGGRCFEYYSEDSYLTGIMGAKTVHAASAKGLYTFMKHFALNEQDEYRAWYGGLVTWANEQTIREIYLKPFEMAVKVPDVDTHYYEYTDEGTYERKTVKTPGCMGIMTSFNRLGATWTGGNYNLLTLVLRGEWGFKGFALTDFKERSYMIAGQEVFAGGDAVLSTVNTGTDLRPGKNDTQYYYSRQAARNILYTIVNSNRMNGAVHGAKFISGIAYYRIILIVWDVVASLVMALGAFFIVWEVLKAKNIIKPKGKQGTEEAAAATESE